MLKAVSFIEFLVRLTSVLKTNTEGPLSVVSAAGPLTWSNHMGLLEEKEMWTLEFLDKEEGKAH